MGCKLVGKILKSYLSTWCKDLIWWIPMGFVTNLMIVAMVHWSWFKGNNFKFHNSSFWMTIPKYHSTLNPFIIVFSLPSPFNHHKYKINIIFLQHKIVMQIKYYTTQIACKIIKTILKTQIFVWQDRQKNIKHKIVS